MPTLFAIMVLGLFLGMRHATDPDHVVAVTTIVSREPTLFNAALIGAFWGLGHTLTIVCIGSAIIVFKLTIPARLGLTMEFSVALMLILLGALSLTGLMHRIMNWRLLRQYVGAHAHVIAGRRMFHSHDAGEDFLNDWAGPDFGPGIPWYRKLGLFHIVRPLAVGVVHGLAGSAAVALLVLTTIGNAGWAVGYLLVFGIGTIIGMMMITAAIALPFTYTRRHFARLNQTLTIASGVASLSFGLFLCYRVGVVDGLFTSHPNWMPR